MSEEVPDIRPEVSETEEYTVEDYLQGVSDLLSEGALRTILAKRHICPGTPVYLMEQRDLDLAEAEVYFHLSNLPVGGATNKETDGSWSSTSGGWTVSSANIAEWHRKYTALREKWGEQVYAKSTIKVHARGMRVWRRK